MDSEDTVVADEGQAPTMVAEPKPKTERKKREVPRYNVILWDSDEHSYEYVERMLHELFGHTQEQCHKMAETVDTQGKVVVFTTTQGARRAEARPDSRLRQGRQHPQLQRLDARDHRVGDRECLWCYSVSVGGDAEFAPVGFEFGLAADAKSLNH